EVVRLRVAGGRHLGLDVAGGGEDERRPPRQELGGPVAPVPRSQVVGEAAGDVVVDLDGRQVDRRAEDLEPARLGQQVAGEDVEELAVEAAGEVRLAVVPGQDVDGPRRL